MQADDPNEMEGRALRRAAAAGDLETIQQLLARGAEANRLDNAALRWAVSHKQTGAARLLIEVGAPLDSYAREFLTLAARNGDVPTLELLLARLPGPSDPELLNKLLLLAVGARSVQAVRGLVEAGADPEAEDNKPLLSAACNGDAPMLRLLLLFGADVNAKNSQSLFNATFARSPEAVRILLEGGVDVEVQRGAALQLAILNGDAELVEMLLDAGMPMICPDWVLDTAHADSVQTLQLLIHHGAKLPTFANDLVRKAADEVAPRILSHVLANAPVDHAALGYGLEPAVRKASSAVVRLLLDAGADPTTNNSAGFRVAIESGEIGLARWLLQAGASIADLNGSTVAQVLSAADTGFLVELLHGGLKAEVAGLVPFQAVMFCGNVKPGDLFRDASGNHHPEEIRLARLKFARLVANKAAEDLTTGTANPTIWLSEVLQEQVSLCHRTSHR